MPGFLEIEIGITHSRSLLDPPVIPRQKRNGLRSYVQTLLCLSWLLLHGEMEYPIAMPAPGLHLHVLRLLILPLFFILSHPFRVIVAGNLTYNMMFTKIVLNVQVASITSASAATAWVVAVSIGSGLDLRHSQILSACHPQVRRPDRSRNPLTLCVLEDIKSRQMWQKGR